MGFEQKTVGLPAGNVTYHVAGTGRPLLYLHGGSGVMFTEPLTRLAESRRVYIPVTPGYDTTDALDGVANVQDLAGLWASFVDVVIDGANTDVMGFSFGGLVAAWLAATHPDKVDQLILAAPGGLTPTGSVTLSDDPKKRLAQMYRHPENLPDGESPGQRLARSREAMARYRPNFDRDEALAARLGDIEALTLVLMGTEDGVTPAEVGQMLRRELKHAHLIYVYDAAHALEVDQPARVTTLLTDFLERGDGFLVNWGGEPAEAAPATR